MTHSGEPRVPQPLIQEAEIANLEQVQNRLSTALVTWARDNRVAAKDWVQGGWTRASANLTDKVEIGLRQAAPPN